MLGACLAVFWHPRQLAGGIPPVRPRVVGVVGFVGLAGLAALCLLATERGAFLYRGGFLLVDLATLAVIAAVAHPGVRFGRRLGIPLLVYIGLRSYSIYLWHWPVFALTRPGEDLGAGPAAVFVLRLVLTLVLADLSFRLIEAPIRSGAIGRWTADWRASRGAERARKTRRVFVVGLAGAGALFVLTSAIVSAKPATNDIEESLKAGQAALAAQTTAAALATTGTRPVDGGAAAGAESPSSVAGEPEVVGSTPVPTVPAVGTLPPVETTTTVILPPIPVIALGDSVMLGAVPKLLEALGADTYVDAVVGRQYKDALPILQSLGAQGRFGRAVVLHLGNNGPMSAATFRSVMDSLVNVPLVLVVNARVTKPWEPAVNQVLAEQVPTYPNARLMDWWGESAMHGDWFYDDKTHLNPAGAAAYAMLVTAAVSGTAPVPTTTVPPATPAPTAAPVETTAAPVVVETTAAPLPPP
jgi:hypothetical protein